MPRVAALVLAAGSGTRFGRDKLAIYLGGRPVWQWSVAALATHSGVDWVGVVVSPEADATEFESFRLIDLVISGGVTRLDSSRLGLLAVPDDCEIVLIHDAARPLLSQSVISAVIDAVATHPAVCPTIPVVDTIRSGSEILDRSKLQAIQTPQAGRLVDLRSAYNLASGDETDDLAVLAHLGIQPTYVPGEKRNMKLTHPEDLPLLEAYLGPAETRTGLGYDVHAFSTDPDRPMWLGGIEFDDRPGLDGHSDADALIHALVDAILGAANLGDIGLLYPNTDPQWKNCPSLVFLKETAQKVTQLGWEIVNCDCSVIAERPKIMVRRLEICRALAQAMSVEETRVSVKATTNEKLGAIGRGEGIAAFAVATLRRSGLPHGG